MTVRRLLLKNTSFNIAGYVFLTVAGLISLPILLSNLGNTWFGVYLLLIGFIPLIGSVDYGLSKATIRQLALPEITLKNRASVWKSSFDLFLITGVANTIIAFVILLISVNKLGAISSLGENFLVPILLLSVIVFVNHLNIFLLILPQAEQRFEIYATRTFIVGAGNTFVPALLSYKTHSLSVLIAAILVFQVISLITLYTVNSPMVKVAIDDHLKPKKILIHYGLRQFLGNLASQIDIQSSKVILSALLNSSAITFFSLPQNLIIKAAGGVSQLTLALFPLSAKLSNKENFPHLKLLIKRLQFGVLILGIIQVITVYLFGGALLQAWLRDTQVVAMCLPVLKILSWYFLFTTLTPIPSSVLEALGYPQIPSFFAILTTLIDLPLMWYLTSRYNYLGPAYSLVISSVITVPIFLFVFAALLNRYQKIHLQ